MQRLSLISTVEKYRLASTNPWYVLLKMDPNGAAPVGSSLTPIYIAHNSDDVTWNGQLYQAFPFEMDAIEDKANGQLPTVSLRVSNVNRLLEALVNEYAGLVGAIVTVWVVQAIDPDNPVFMQTFWVTGAQADAEWITFSLGADNPMLQPMPKFLYMANVCRHRYNSPGVQAANDPMGICCGYEGSLPSCDKTLEGPNGCREHSNVIRFGGFPGIETNGFLSASSAS